MSSSTAKRLAVLAASLAAIAWRISVIRIAFQRPSLPAEYFAAASTTGPPSSSCHILQSDDNRLSSCEDATFWDFLDGSGNLVDRKIIASCDPNRKNWNTVMGPLRDPNPRGALWLVEFESEKESTREIQFHDYPHGKDFHPLGVQIWPSKSGIVSNMFVVNHGRQNSTIEQFVIHPKHPWSAKFIRTITSPYFVSPNSLALTSPTSFFVSNDHLLTRRLPSVLGKVLPMVETLAGLPLAFIGHVSVLNDAVSGGAVIQHTVAKLGIPFPNGIALSPDNRILAVASSSNARVYFFSRTQNMDGIESLTYIDHVSLPFAPDHLHYSEDGVLFAAGHPYFPALIAVAANKTGVMTPSWVVSISRYNHNEDAPRNSADYDTNAPFSAARRVKATSNYNVETVYQGDGSIFAGSTTGLKDSRSGTVFVAGLYQEGLLICRP